MCHTVQEGILANALFFLRSEERRASKALAKCTCGGHCTACDFEEKLLREIRGLKAYPFNSWSRRSWVRLARASKAYHDGASSGLGGFYFDFAWLLWLSARDATGCVPGPREAVLREQFDQAYDTVTFHWNAAAFHPWSEDYYAARSAALWMEGR